MNVTLLPKFTELYEVYRHSDDYALRVKNFAVVELNREIIVETLKNEPLLNEHLTGLIQLFKVGCTNKAFDKYLDQNVTDLVRRKEISEKADKIDEWGYTGAGLNAVTKLTPVQLVLIKTFLQTSFDLTSIEEAVNLCKIFDSENIPYVKSGIYSPWLYYINSKMFPLLNDSHIKFREWIGMPADYPSCIKDYSELKRLVNEKELGLIDMFAYNFEKYSKPSIDLTVLNLSGKRLYKMSHGVFKKNTNFKKAGIAPLLEKNKWISMGLDTGSGQATGFIDNASIGDFVYVCYGGDDLYAIGRIVSDSMPCDAETEVLLNSKEKWIYREIEPLYFPENTSIKELKTDHRMFLPSGNSTFWEVPKAELEFMNKNIFIPKFGVQIIDDSIPEVSNNSEDSQNNLKDFPMNTILYGSPGTGKTFHSISHSVAIVEKKTIKSIIAEKRESVKKRFDQYVKDGQIVFCTFHQSLGYEDFIEGIKPIVSSSDEELTDEEPLSYTIVDGILKRLCTEAAFSFIQHNLTTVTEKVLDFSIEYDRFVNYVNDHFAEGKKPEISTISGQTLYIERISQKNNILIRHINGTRSYIVSKQRLSKISQAFPVLSEVTNINDQFGAEIGGSNASAYWAVLNAIRNQPKEAFTKTNKTISEKEYSYDDKKEAIESLKNDDYKIANPKKFVLIIDEINRGNVSQIFGELITLIEEDKRLGKEESLKAILPYSKDNFGVPCNLHIIGTMNTADRSVEALDTALRRRFSFVSMTPQPEELKNTTDGINLPEMLRLLNSRLSILKDDDHTIGHAWLWDVKNVEQLKTAFANKILPLLQEYFYNDYEKLGLVLGDAFFVLPHKRVVGNEFAAFSGSSGLSGQYRNKYIYKLKNTDDLTVTEFLTLTQVSAVNDD